MNVAPEYYSVLTIAGSDSSGGAGLQADLKTFSALGCYGLSVVTALTAQNTQAVTAIQPVPADFVLAQLEAVFADIPIKAVKIGMLHSAGIIKAVAAFLRRREPLPLVVDAVMVAKGGARLLEADAVAALQSELLPLASIITPNLPEAELLSGRPVNDLESMRCAAQILLGQGPTAVLVKGGHLADSYCSDVLLLADGEELLQSRRCDTPNTHGTGCTLSAAIAALLARGSSLPSAVRGAKDYLSSALAVGAQYRLGEGHGPVHHFYSFWR